MKYKSMVAACISIRFMTGALLVFFGMEYLKASKFFVDSYIVYSLYRKNLLALRYSASIIPQKSISCFFLIRISALNCLSSLQACYIVFCLFIL